MTNYKPRTFCNAVACDIQLQLNDADAGSEKRQLLKDICRTECRKTAWEFHDWLQENGYRIEKYQQSYGNIPNLADLAIGDCIIG